MEEPLGDVTFAALAFFDFCCLFQLTCVLTPFYFESELWSSRRLRAFMVMPNLFDGF